MYAYNDFSWPAAADLEKLSLQATPWAWYEATQVTFGSPQLHGTVRPVADGGGHQQPPGGTLHVITAVQPGTAPDTADNALRMRLLDRELAGRGLRAIRAVGTSFDGEHAEQSRAVFGLDDTAARRLGLRFGQVAVFAWAGPRWSLLACAGERQTHRPWQWDPAG